MNTTAAVEKRSLRRTTVRRLTGESVPAWSATIVCVCDQHIVATEGMKEAAQMSAARQHTAHVEQFGCGQ
ncbi:MAG TPA: hypothetical protein VJ323_08700 [Bryobacteraceae bacterium]|nr:hypothetical protein [Bryobacteraceae bacterium]